MKGGIMAVVAVAVLFAGATWGRPAPPAPHLPPAVVRVLASAHAQTQRTRLYDPAYVVLPYPSGDVPADRGVCTDVVIRCLRAGGVDLQRAIHEDMQAHFAAYPHQWGLRRPDPNIDQRRVPNQQTFFARHGKSLPVTKNGADYLPGDIVTWRLPGGLAHTGVVSDAVVAGTNRRAMIHNIEQGAREEDVLFAWAVTGHYRYFR